MYRLVYNSRKTLVSSTNMLKGKNKHECNKKLIVEGNEKKEQESKIFLKKGLFGGFLNYQSGMCDELREQWDKAKVEGVTSNPTGF